MKINEADHVYTNIFVKWLYSICEDCESIAELQYSLHALDCWLVCQTNVSPNLREFTANYLEKSFKTQTHKLCQSHFQNLYGGQLGSNSISEQENSALKRDHMGPRPNSGIDRSFIATTSHEGRRLKQLRRAASQSLSQTVVHDVIDDVENSEVLSANSDVEYDAVDKSYLSKHLIDRAWKDIVSQCEASWKYLYYHAPGSTDYLVRRSTWEIHQTDNAENIHHAYVPKFDRTRTVTISNSKC
jgi:hypothetical protein